MAASKAGAVNLDDVEGTEEQEVDLLEQEIDFEKVKGSKTVDHGTYHLRVEGCTAKLSKSSNKPMLSFRVMVLEGEEEGVTVFVDLPLSEGAQGRSKTILVGMGMPETANWSPKTIAAEAKGWEFYAVLDTEQSDGINKRTQKAYDPRNKILKTSVEPIYDDD